MPDRGKRFYALAGLGRSGETLRYYGVFLLSDESYRVTKAVKWSPGRSGKSRFAFFERNK